MAAISVVEYDTGWPYAFERARDEISPRRAACSSDLVARYAALKRDAATRHTDTAGYTRAKTAFV
jgi:GrpB-like predicted nucleotidyltransferase (UPF0157 family)